MEAEKAARRSGRPPGTIVLATVKGDVHDIGKNIVGVVLACNNYEIIDLGVMTPASKILAVARERKADAIGLSGLITPSLDEMVHVAAEMEREGFDIPLLIGGATTSRVHTAVKIHPRYARSQAVHVNDASRAVGVVSSLLSPETRASDHRGGARRIPQGGRGARAERSREDARAARQGARQRLRRSTGAPTQPTRPSFLGTRVFESYDLAELARYIDWTPFFQTWELKGRYPAILDDPEAGRGGAGAVRRRAGDAEADHRGEVARSRRRWSASGRPARTATTSRSSPTKSATTPDRDASTPCASSSPGATAARTSRSPISSARRGRDYVGGFVVTAGVEDEEIAERFERANDDYSSILVKALADRLAEAFAEAMHARVRRELWGYAPDEGFRAGGADRRALSRHPPRARLSGPARPHREGDAVPPARRGAGDRRQAHRELRHVAGLVGVGPLHRPSGGALFRRRPRSSATRSRTTRRARAWSVAEVERWLAPVLNYVPVRAEAAE